MKTYLHEEISDVPATLHIVPTNFDALCNKVLDDGFDASELPQLPADSEERILLIEQISLYFAKHGRFPSIAQIEKVPA